MALARVQSLTYTYPGATRPALEDVSLELQPGEVVVVFGASGCGKSTLLRALAGLVPHFHGGRFAGCVEVGGRDTRRTMPSQLAGTVATVFQDPEDQVVMTVVANEVAFGLENVGVAPQRIWPAVERALASVDIRHLHARRTSTLSGGELQRVCLASALALEPELVLLDEPTSQLDPAAAEAFLEHVAGLDAAVVLSEHRSERVLEIADRVVFMDDGRIVFDGARAEAERWLAANRPEWVPGTSVVSSGATPSDAVVTLDDIWLAYDGNDVLRGERLAVRRGEVLALQGPNGSGKTTLAKIAAGLLEPRRGSVRLGGSAGYLSQDPGRYVTTETALAEAALAVGGDESRARPALARVGLEWAASRHPRDLSSGERERLGLAAVAVREPDLLVLDEPTRGVDPARKAALGEWLRAYASAGRGVLVVTHDRTFPADRRVTLGGRARERPEVLVGV